MNDPTSSPKWKKPSDIMKKHRKKKRLSQQNMFDEKPPDKLADIFNVNNAFLQTHSKRRNPFSQESQVDSPSKRRKSDSDEGILKPDTAQENVLFSILGAVDKVQQENQCSLQIEQSTPIQRQVSNFSLEDDDSRSQFDFIQKFFKGKQNERSIQKASEPEVPPQPDDVPSRSVPVDWSLKAKLRVISEKPLLWCTQLRTAEEAKGIGQFLTGTPATLQVPHKEAEEKAHFQEAGLYWVYPSLPWMKLFPRILPDAKLRTSSAALLDNLIQSALQSDWTESFTSAFHQLRAQYCPYFYVCTHQFTVLFRASGVASQTCLSAVLSPTTRGMRESLKAEDITFSMPLLDRRKHSIIEENNTKQVSEPQKPRPPCPNEEEDDDLIDTDEGASVWLESIGLDKKQFPSLDPKKVKVQREGFKVIDNRPESLVCVTGADVQGLYNYLLNCRSCVPTSGPQAGLPPTILAPMAFTGATLKSHKVKHSIVKQMDDNKHIKPVHILEVSGPVLPHHLARYKSLFHHTQEGDFSLTLNTHEPSIPFNAPLGSEEMELHDSATRAQCMMGHEKFDSFFNNEPIDDRLTCIREIHCKSGKFSFVV